MIKWAITIYDKATNRPTLTLGLRYPNGDFRSTTDLWRTYEFDSEEAADKVIKAYVKQGKLNLDTHYYKIEGERFKK